MAPLASGVPVGASHGIGYVLGTMFDIPHGHTSCIMLSAVMRWNKSANTERQALVAAAMGHAGEDAGDVLDAFIAGLGMPRSLAAVNVAAENFDRMAEQAMGTPTAQRSPSQACGWTTVDRTEAARKQKHRPPTKSDQRISTIVDSALRC